LPQVDRAGTFSLKMAISFFSAVEKTPVDQAIVLATVAEIEKQYK